MKGAEMALRVVDGWPIVAVTAVFMWSMSNEPAHADWTTSITRGVIRSFNQKIPNEIERNTQKNITNDCDESCKSIVKLFEDSKEYASITFDKYGMDHLIKEIKFCYSNNNKLNCAIIDAYAKNLSNSVFHKMSKIESVFFSDKIFNNRIESAVNHEFSDKNSRENMIIYIMALTGNL
ncbi:hypothetical protein [Shinella zoogloeoides]|uniref:hypothetical protein n=1 Tax=Shinella zoogloeoides TaxID=352475 RepID=UPI001F57FAFC|nr:hypothetical protein [Shinella zoogloeoides]